MNPGNFGSIDTRRRLQVARWIRLGEPEVSPADTAFGIRGRHGVRHAWYGMGQSLVLVPFDAAVSVTTGPLLQRSGLSPERREQIVELLNAFLMQFAITSLILVLAYETLLSFGFTPFPSAAGALALLFGTTCLAYVQTAQENNLLLALDLAALWAVRRSRQTGGAWPVLAGAACGLAILTRVPSLLDTAVFAWLAWAYGGRWKRFLAAYLPPVLAALAIDRWYQWMRFGEFFSTYISVFGRQARPPGAPASFPFSYPFWQGFGGTFFSADKSILLFDPLLLLLIVLAAWRWRKLDRDVRSTLAAFSVLLLAYAAVYATYFDFGGDVAWGHRFVIVPVQLLALFAVPVLLTYGKTLPSLWRRAAWTVVFLSAALQASSTAVAPNLEVMQRDLGYRQGVVWNRAVNLAQLAAGREDSARFRGIPEEWRSLYYFPFQLRFRFPRLAKWAMGAWLALLLCLPLLVYATLRAARRDASLH
ncbi:MAG TPA: hypothetical protein VFC10_06895 [Terriglobia bacterium]|nr:hypothetical protein [Terriglobia bacterium]